jgi:subtilisin family serine protease
MTHRTRSSIVLILLAAGVFARQTTLAQPRRPMTPRIPPAAIAQARSLGTTRVIVGLDVAFAPESLLGAADALAQRNSIATAQDAVMGRMVRIRPSSVRRFSYIPFLALEVDEAALQALAASPEVNGIEIDALAEPTLAESTPLIGAPAAWAAGYIGAGWTVAILDTGVDYNHPFLAGKVVSEACYSSTTSQSDSVCPGGVSSSTAPGSAVPCALSSCRHGTHVAGIAAGAGSSFSGVAKGASIIAIQVFSSFRTGCSVSPCPQSYMSDQILGLERVYALRGTYRIAAVNMSLGSGLFTSPCDSSSTKAIIDQLRAAGIATVVASGNNGSAVALSSPACISTAISVGSTDDGSFGTVADSISEFSNSNQFLTLLAPGRWINSSVPGGGFANFSGTSMAAPHVTGAWAILKSRRPTATVTEIADALATTGTALLDARNGITKPRINVYAAVQALPPGCIYSVNPTRVDVGRFAGTTTMSVTTAAGCPWSASSLSPFVSVVSGATGTGSGSVTLSYASSARSREGIVSIAGIGLTIAQHGGNTGDVNGDGRADIIWQHIGDGSLAVWFLDGFTVIGTESLSINRVTDLNWRVVGSGDLDGDGYADLVWQHQTTGALAVWFLRGPQVLSTQFLSIDRVADTNWKIRGVADTNGDGMADLIWQHQTEGWLAVWYMNGAQVTGTQSLGVNRVVDTDWQIAGAGDTNGDGKADIIWQHRTGGWLAVWYMDGIRVIGTNFLSVDRMPNLEWHIRGVGDVNGDGKADVLWQNDTTGGLGVWYLDGFTVTGQWRLSIDPIPDTNWKVAGPG